MVLTEKVSEEKNWKYTAKTTESEVSVSKAIVIVIGVPVIAITGVHVMADPFVTISISLSEIVISA